MAKRLLPFLVEPEELESHLDDERLLIVDLASQQGYLSGHIPAAIHLDYSMLLRSRPPVTGLLPDETHLSRLFSSLGLTPERHVVAYDDEGNGRACRLLWTLDAIGHFAYSLLDGGLRAWRAQGRPLVTGPQAPTPSDYRARMSNPDALAVRDDILRLLHDENTLVLDVRSPAEYRGEDVRALRGGHIPGAVNFEWTRAMDPGHDLRLRPAEELRQTLKKLGVTPDKLIITHCQSHHRSAHTYIMLKYLGYPRVRGYAGSWSEWGNDPELPVEIDG